MKLHRITGEVYGGAEDKGIDPSKLLSVGWERRKKSRRHQKEE